MQSNHTAAPGGWRRFVGIGTALAAFAAAPSAFAATLEVGPGKAYATLADVKDKLAPGDVVLVTGDATYPGDVKLSSNGSAGKPIVIKGVRVNGKRPVLSGGTNTIQLSGDHYVLEGFDITGGAGRCVFLHGDDLTVRDTVVHDCPAHGILGADADTGSLTLDYVEVYHCGAGTNKHSVYIATDEETHKGSVFRMQHSYVHDTNGGNAVKTRAERNEIYSNWIEGAAYRELELIGPDGQDESLAREDSDVVGNVIRNTSGYYVVRVGGDGTGQTNGRYRFVNNTFLLSSGERAVFQAFDGIESIEMDNNVFWHDGGVQILRDSDAHWVTGQQVIGGAHNWVPSGSSALPSQWSETTTGANPGFKSLGDFDVDLAADSPLVDLGGAPSAGPPGHEVPNALALPTYLPPARHLEEVDTATARAVVGKTIDVGAFEFGNSGAAALAMGVSTSEGEGAPASGSSSTPGAAATPGAGSAPSKPEPSRGAEGCSLGGGNGGGAATLGLALAALALALKRR